jgi:hypothetical protein
MDGRGISVNMCYQETPPYSAGIVSNQMKAVAILTEVSPHRDREREGERETVKVKLSLYITK